MEQNLNVIGADCTHDAGNWRRPRKMRQRANDSKIQCLSWPALVRSRCQPLSIAIGAGCWVGLTAPVAQALKPSCWHARPKSSWRKGVQPELLKVRRSGAAKKVRYRPIGPGWAAMIVSGFRRLSRTRGLPSPPGRIPNARPWSSTTVRSFRAFQGCD